MGLGSRVSKQRSTATKVAGRSSLRGGQPSGWPFFGTWLLQPVFAVDILICPRCRGAMSLLGLSSEHDAIARMLATVGLRPRPPSQPRPPLPSQLELKLSV